MGAQRHGLRHRERHLASWSGQLVSCGNAPIFMIRVGGASGGEGGAAEGDGTAEHGLRRGCGWWGGRDLTGHAISISVDVGRANRGIGGVLRLVLAALRRRGLLSRCLRVALSATCPDVCGER
jgi:hypothetical protein